MLRRGPRHPLYGEGNRWYDGTMKTPSEPPRYVPPPAPVAHGDGERLQKILSAAGLGSRRDCEELILAGRVEVDRRVVTTLGTKANPHDQEIRVDGEPLHRSKLVYYMVNKPVGVVTTNADPDGRPRVIDLVPDKGGHLYPVGRLDMSSEGLILVTNDGEMANRLTHPRYGVEKTYHVEVAGRLDEAQLQELRKGIYLSEGFAKVAGATIKKQLSKSTLLEVVLDEGKNREIRRLLARVGHKVLRLRRIAVGPLRLGELPVGTFRQLTHEEIQNVQKTTSGKRRGPKRPGAKGRRRPPGGARTGPPRRAVEKKGDVPRTGSVIGGDVAPKPRKILPGARPAKSVQGGKPPRRSPGGKPPGRGVGGGKGLGRSAGKKGSGRPAGENPPKHQPKGGRRS